MSATLEMEKKGAKNIASMNKGFRLSATRSYASEKESSEIQEKVVKYRREVVRRKTGERKSLVDGCPLRFCSSVLMDQQERVLRKFFAPGPKVNMDSPTDK